MREGPPESEEAIKRYSEKGQQLSQEEVEARIRQAECISAADQERKIVDLKGQLDECIREKLDLKDELASAINRFYAAQEDARKLAEALQDYADDDELGAAARHALAEYRGEDPVGL